MIVETRKDMSTVLTKKAKFITSRSDSNSKTQYTVLRFYCFSYSMKVQKNKKTVKFIAPYAQKSSTVSNLEMSRRLACHVLLLSFLKNHRDHLLVKKQEKGFLHKCIKPLNGCEVNKRNQKPLSFVANE